MSTDEKLYTYDECCFSLAEHFLSDHNASPTQLKALAQAFQEAAERFLEGEQTTESWTCFHCGETFTYREEARLHFGDRYMSDVACQIDRRGLADQVYTNG